MKRTVYLAGPICELSGTEAQNWRNHAREHLSFAGIIGISPLRSEPDPELNSDGKYQNNYSDPMFSDNALLTKNMFDVRNCDLTLAYLPYYQTKNRFSIGTMLEIGMCFALKKPVIVVTNDKRISDHPLIKAGAGWLLDDLDDGLMVACDILGDYV